MGLSNYLPSSRINQSGVCTSSTRPASPYEGQLIFETDTDRVLVWNNSAWVDPSTGKAERSGSVKIGSFSNSNTNSITCNSVFTSSYENYRFELNGIATSSIGSVYIEFRVGSTPTTSSYAFNNIYSTHTGGPSREYNGSTTKGKVGIIFTSYGSGISGDIFSPQTTKVTTYNSSSSGWGASSNEMNVIAGTQISNTQFDGVAFICDTNFTGVVSIYGYN